MRCHRKDSLTLIEIMVAVTIFSVLSVSLYFLFRSGVSLRRKFEAGPGQIQSVYLNLDRMAQEMRNSIEWNAAESGFAGKNNGVEFYTVLFDYSENQPQVYHINYTFEDGVLLKKMVIPLQESEDARKEFSYIDNVEHLEFSYQSSEADEPKGEWGQDEDKGVLPKKVNIDLKYSLPDDKSRIFSKKVFIYTGK